MSSFHKPSEMICRSEILGGNQNPTLLDEFRPSFSSPFPGDYLLLYPKSVQKTSLSDDKGGFSMSNSMNSGKVVQSNSVYNSDSRTFSESMASLHNWGPSDASGNASIPNGRSISSLSPNAEILASIESGALSFRYQSDKFSTPIRSYASIPLSVFEEIYLEARKSDEDKSELRSRQVMLESIFSEDISHLLYNEWLWEDLFTQVDSGLFSKHTLRWTPDSRYVIIFSSTVIMSKEQALEYVRTRNESLQRESVRDDPIHDAISEEYKEIFEMEKSSVDQNVRSAQVPDINGSEIEFSMVIVDSLSLSAVSLLSSQMISSAFGERNQENAKSEDRHEDEHSTYLSRSIEIQNDSIRRFKTLFESVKESHLDFFVLDSKLVQNDKNQDVSRDSSMSLSREFSLLEKQLYNTYNVSLLMFLPSASPQIMNFAFSIPNDALIAEIYNSLPNDAVALRKLIAARVQILRKGVPLNWSVSASSLGDQVSSCAPISFRSLGYFDYLGTAGLIENKDKGAIKELKLLGHRKTRITAVNIVQTPHQAGLGGPSGLITGSHRVHVVCISHYLMEGKIQQRDNILSFFRVYLDDDFTPSVSFLGSLPVNTSILSQRQRSNGNGTSPSLAEKPGVRVLLFHPSGKRLVSLSRSDQGDSMPSQERDLASRWQSLWKTLLRTISRSLVKNCRRNRYVQRFLMRPNSVVVSTRWSTRRAALRLLVRPSMVPISERAMLRRGLRVLLRMIRNAPSTLSRLIRLISLSPEAVSNLIMTPRRPASSNVNSPIPASRSDAEPSNPADSSRSEDPRSLCAEDFTPEDEAWVFRRLKRLLASAALSPFSHSPVLAKLLPSNSKEVDKALDYRRRGFVIRSALVDSNLNVLDGESEYPSISSISGAREEAIRKRRRREVLNRVKKQMEAYKHFQEEATADTKVQEFLQGRSTESSLSSETVLFLQFAGADNRISLHLSSGVVLILNISSSNDSIVGINTTSRNGFSIDSFRIIISPDSPLPAAPSQLGSPSSMTDITSIPEPSEFIVYDGCPEVGEVSLSSADRLIVSFSFLSYSSFVFSTNQGNVYICGHDSSVSNYTTILNSTVNLPMRNDEASVDGSSDFSETTTRRRRTVQDGGDEDSEEDDKYRDGDIVSAEKKVTRKYAILIPSFKSELLGVFASDSVFVKPICKWKSDINASVVVKRDLNQVVDFSASKNVWEQFQDLLLSNSTSLVDPPSIDSIDSLSNSLVGDETTDSSGNRLVVRIVPKPIFGSAALHKELTEEHILLSTILYSPVDGLRVAGDLVDVTVNDSNAPVYHISSNLVSLHASHPIVVIHQRLLSDSLFQNHSSDNSLVPESAKFLELFESLKPLSAGSKNGYVIGKCSWNELDLTIRVRLLLDDILQSRVNIQFLNQLEMSESGSFFAVKSPNARHRMFASDSKSMTVCLLIKEHVETLCSIFSDLSTIPNGPSRSVIVGIIGDILISSLLFMTPLMASDASVDSNDAANGETMDLRQFARFDYCRKHVHLLLPSSNSVLSELVKLCDSFVHYLQENDTLSGTPEPAHLEVLLQRLRISLLLQSSLHSSTVSDEDIENPLHHFVKMLELFTLCSCSIEHVVLAVCCGGFRSLIFETFENSTVRLRGLFGVPVHLNSSESNFKTLINASNESDSLSSSSTSFKSLEEIPTSYRALSLLLKWHSMINCSSQMTFLLWRAIESVFLRVITDSSLEKSENTRLLQVIPFPSSTSIVEFDNQQDLLQLLQSSVRLWNDMDGNRMEGFGRVLKALLKGTLVDMSKLRVCPVDDNTPFSPALSALGNQCVLLDDDLNAPAFIDLPKNVFVEVNDTLRNDLNRLSVVLVRLTNVLYGSSLALSLSGNGASAEAALRLLQSYLQNLSTSLKKLPKLDLGQSGNFQEVYDKCQTLCANASVALRTLDRILEHLSPFQAIQNCVNQRITASMRAATTLEFSNEFLFETLFLAPFTSFVLHHNAAAEARFYEYMECLLKDLLPQLALSTSNGDFHVGAMEEVACMIGKSVWLFFRFSAPSVQINMSPDAFLSSVLPALFDKNTASVLRPLLLDVCVEMVNRENIEFRSALLTSLSSALPFFNEKFALQCYYSLLDVKALDTTLNGKFVASYPYCFVHHDTNQGRRLQFIRSSVFSNSNIYPSFEIPTSLCSETSTGLLFSRPIIFDSISVLILSVGSLVAPQFIHHCSLLPIVQCAMAAVVSGNFENYNTLIGRLRDFTLKLAEAMAASEELNLRQSSRSISSPGGKYRRETPRSPFVVKSFIMQSPAYKNFSDVLDEPTPQIDLQGRSPVVEIPEGEEDSPFLLSSTIFRKVNPSGSVNISVGLPILLQAFQVSWFLVDILAAHIASIALSEGAARRNESAAELEWKNETFFHFAEVLTLYSVGTTGPTPANPMEILSTFLRSQPLSSTNNSASAIKVVHPLTLLSAHRDSTDYHGSVVPIPSTPGVTRTSMVAFTFSPVINVGSHKLAPHLRAMSAFFLNLPGSRVNINEINHSLLETVLSVVSSWSSSERKQELPGGNSESIDGWGDFDVDLDIDSHLNAGIGDTSSIDTQAVLALIEEMPSISLRLIPTIIHNLTIALLAFLPNFKLLSVHQTALSLAVLGSLPNSPVPIIQLTRTLDALTLLGTTLSLSHSSSAVSFSSSSEETGLSMKPQPKFELSPLSTLLILYEMVEIPDSEFHNSPTIGDCIVRGSHGDEKHESKTGTEVIVKRLLHVVPWAYKVSGLDSNVQEVKAPSSITPSTFNSKLDEFFSKNDSRSALTKSTVFVPYFGSILNKNKDAFSEIFSATLDGNFAASAAISMDYGLVMNPPPASHAESLSFAERAANGNTSIFFFPGFQYEHGAIASFQIDFDYSNWVSYKDLISDYDGKFDSIPDFHPDFMVPIISSLCVLPPRLAASVPWVCESPKFVAKSLSVCMRDMGFESKLIDGENVTFFRSPMNRLLAIRALIMIKLNLFASVPVGAVEEIVPNDVIVEAFRLFERSFIAKSGSISYEYSQFSDSFSHFGSRSYMERTHDAGTNAKTLSPALVKRSVENACSELHSSIRLWFSYFEKLSISEHAQERSTVERSAEAVTSILSKALAVAAPPQSDSNSDASGSVPSFSEALGAATTEARNAASSIVSSFLWGRKNEEVQPSTTADTSSIIDSISTSVNGEDKGPATDNHQELKEESNLGSLPLEDLFFTFVRQGSISSKAISPLTFTQVNGRPLRSRIENYSNAFYKYRSGSTRDFYRKLSSDISVMQDLMLLKSGDSDTPHFSSHAVTEGEVRTADDTAQHESAYHSSGYFSSSVLGELVSNSSATMSGSMSILSNMLQEEESISLDTSFHDANADYEAGMNAGTRSQCALRQWSFAEVISGLSLPLSTCYSSTHSVKTASQSGSNDKATVSGLKSLLAVKIDDLPHWRANSGVRDFVGKCPSSCVIEKKIAPIGSSLIRLCNQLKVSHEFLDTFLTPLREALDVERSYSGHLSSGEEQKGTSSIFSSLSQRLDLCQAALDLRDYPSFTQLIGITIPTIVSHAVRLSDIYRATDSMSSLDETSLREISVIESLLRQFYSITAQILSISTCPLAELRVFLSKFIMMAPVIRDCNDVDQHLNEFANLVESASLILSGSPLLASLVVKLGNGRYEDVRKLLTAGKVDNLSFIQPSSGDSLPSSSGNELLCIPFPVDLAGELLSARVQTRRQLSESSNERAFEPGPQFVQAALYLQSKSPFLNHQELLSSYLSSSRDIVRGGLNESAFRISISTLLALKSSSSYSNPLKTGLWNHLVFLSPWLADVLAPILSPSPYAFDHVHHLSISSQRKHPLTSIPKGDEARLDVAGRTPAKARSDLTSILSNLAESAVGSTLEMSSLAFLKSQESFIESLFFASDYLSHFRTNLTWCQKLWWGLDLYTVADDALKVLTASVKGAGSDRLSAISRDSLLSLSMELMSLCGVLEPSLIVPAFADVNSVAAGLLPSGIALIVALSVLIVVENDQESKNNLEHCRSTLFQKMQEGIDSYSLIALLVNTAIRAKLSGWSDEMELSSTFMDDIVSSSAVGTVDLHTSGVSVSEKTQNLVLLTLITSELGSISFLRALGTLKFMCEMTSFLGGNATTLDYIHESVSKFASGQVSERSISSILSLGTAADSYSIALRHSVENPSSELFVKSLATDRFHLVPDPILPPPPSYLSVLSRIFSDMIVPEFYQLLILGLADSSLSFDFSSFEDLILLGVKIHRELTGHEPVVVPSLPLLSALTSLRLLAILNSNGNDPAKTIELVTKSPPSLDCLRSICKDLFTEYDDDLLPLAQTLISLIRLSPFGHSLNVELLKLYKFILSSEIGDPGAGPAASIEDLVWKIVHLSRVRKPSVSISGSPSSLKLVNILLATLCEDEYRDYVTSKSIDEIIKECSTFILSILKQLSEALLHFDLHRDLHVSVSSFDIVLKAEFAGKSVECPVDVLDNTLLEGPSLSFFVDSLKDATTAYPSRSRSGSASYQDGLLRLFYTDVETLLTIVKSLQDQLDAALKEAIATRGKKGSSLNMKSASTLKELIEAALSSLRQSINQYESAYPYPESREVSMDTHISSLEASPLPGTDTVQSLTAKGKQPKKSSLDRSLLILSTNALIADHGEILKELIRYRSPSARIDEYEWALPASAFDDSSSILASLVHVLPLVSLTELDDRSVFEEESNDYAKYFGSAVILSEGDSFNLLDSLEFYNVLIDGFSFEVSDISHSSRSVAERALLAENAVVRLMLSHSLAFSVWSHIGIPLLHAIRSAIRDIESSSNGAIAFISKNDKEVLISSLATQELSDLLKLHLSQFNRTSVTEKTTSHISSVSASFARNETEFRPFCNFLESGILPSEQTSAVENNAPLVPNGDGWDDFDFDPMDSIGSHVDMVRTVDDYFEELATFVPKTLSLGDRESGKACLSLSKLASLSVPSDPEEHEALEELRVQLRSLRDLALVLLKFYRASHLSSNRVLFECGSLLGEVCASTTGELSSSRKDGNLLPSIVDNISSVLSLQLLTISGSYIQTCSPLQAFSPKCTSSSILASNFRTILSIEGLLNPLILSQSYFEDESADFTGRRVCKMFSNVLDATSLRLALQSPLDCGTLSISTILSGVHSLREAIIMNSPLRSASSSLSRLEKLVLSVIGSTYNVEGLLLASSLPTLEISQQALISSSSGVRIKKSSTLFATSLFNFFSFVYANSCRYLAEEDRANDQVNNSTREFTVWQSLGRVLPYTPWTLSRLLAKAPFSVLAVCMHYQAGLTPQEGNVSAMSVSAATSSRSLLRRLVSLAAVLSWDRILSLPSSTFSSSSMTPDGAVPVASFSNKGLFEPFMGSLPFLVCSLLQLRDSVAATEAIIVFTVISSAARAPGSSVPPVEGVAPGSSGGLSSILSGLSSTHSSDPISTWPSLCNPASPQWCMGSDSDGDPYLLRLLERANMPPRSFDSLSKRLQYVASFLRSSLRKIAEIVPSASTIYAAQRAPGRSSPAEFVRASVPLAQLAERRVLSSKMKSTESSPGFLQEFLMLDEIASLPSAQEMAIWTGAWGWEHAMQCTLDAIRLCDAVLLKINEGELQELEPWDTSFSDPDHYFHYERDTFARDQPPHNMPYSSSLAPSAINALPFDQTEIEYVDDDCEDEITLAISGLSKDKIAQAQQQKLSALSSIASTTGSIAQENVAKLKEKSRSIGFTVGGFSSKLAHLAKNAIDDLVTNINSIEADDVNASVTSQKTSDDDDWSALSKKLHVNVAKAAPLPDISSSKHFIDQTAFDADFEEFDEVDTACNKVDNVTASGWDEFDVDIDEEVFRAEAAGELESDSSKPVPSQQVPFQEPVVEDVNGWKLEDLDFDFDAAVAENSPTQDIDESEAPLPVEQSFSPLGSVPFAAAAPAPHSIDGWDGDDSLDLDLEEEERMEESILNNIDIAEQVSESSSAEPIETEAGNPSDSHSLVSIIKKVSDELGEVNATESVAPTDGWNAEEIDVSFSSDHPADEPPTASEHASLNEKQSSIPLLDHAVTTDGWIEEDLDLNSDEIDQSEFVQPKPNVDTALESRSSMQPNSSSEANGWGLPSDLDLDDLENVPPVVDIVENTFQSSSAPPVEDDLDRSIKDEGEGSSVQSPRLSTHGYLPLAELETAVGEVVSEEVAVISPSEDKPVDEPISVESVESGENDSNVQPNDVQVFENEKNEEADTESVLPSPSSVVDSTMTGKEEAPSLSLSVSSVSSPFPLDVAIGLGDVSFVDSKPLISQDSKEVPSALIVESVAGTSSLEDTANVAHQTLDGWDEEADLFEELESNPARSPDSSTIELRPMSESFEGGEDEDAPPPLPSMDQIQKEAINFTRASLSSISNFLSTINENINSISMDVEEPVHRNAIDLGDDSDRSRIRTATDSTSSSHDFNSDAIKRDLLARLEQEINESYEDDDQGNDGITADIVFGFGGFSNLKSLVTKQLSEISNVVVNKANEVVEMTAPISTSVPVATSLDNSVSEIPTVSESTFFGKGSESSSHPASAESSLSFSEVEKDPALDIENIDLASGDIEKNAELLASRVLQKKSSFFDELDSDSDDDVVESNQVDVTHSQSIDDETEIDSELLSILNSNQPRNPKEHILQKLTPEQHENTVPNAAHPEHSDSDDDFNMSDIDITQLVNSVISSSILDE